MPRLEYMELNMLQILDVLRASPFLHLAVCGDAQPYVIPMGYQLEVIQTSVILHMAAPDTGRKLDALRRNSRVCACIELPGCAWLDTVIAEGPVRLGAADASGVEILLRAETLSGRRYFHSPE